MQTRYTPFLQFVVLLGDMLLLNLSFIAAGALRFDDLRIQDTEYYDYYVQLAVFVNLSWLLLSVTFKTYRTGLRPEPRQSVGKVLNVYLAHIFLLLLFFVSLKRSDFYSRLFLVYFYSLMGVGVFLWHFYFMRLLRAYRSRGKGGRNVILLGQGQGLERLADVLKTENDYGLRLVGYYSNTPLGKVPVTGSEDLLEEDIHRLEADELYASFPAGDPRWLKWYALADKHLIRFRMVPDLGLSLTSRLQIDFIERIPVLIQRQEPLERYHNRVLKRAMDVFFSCLMIVLVFPWLFPILALMAKSSKGPVFYKQQRAGLNGAHFTIYKFRTLKTDHTPLTHLSPVVTGDSRITRMGKFMRKHSLDELPQFFNVLRGDMSMVGPRPHMLAHTNEYRKQIDRFIVRHFVKPGITGLAQIKGYRGEVQTTADLEARIAADVYYIENWSLLLDIRILATTVLKVLFPDERAV